MPKNSGLRQLQVPRQLRGVAKQFTNTASRENAKNPPLHWGGEGLKSIYIKGNVAHWITYMRINGYVNNQFADHFGGFQRE